MPLMEGLTAVAANALSPNVLAGESHEFLQSDAKVEFYAVGSAAGLRYFLTATPDEIARDTVLTNTGAAILDKDHGLITEYVSAGTRLDWRFRNTTAGALNALWRVRVTYL